MPLEIQPPRPPILADLPHIPAGHVHPKWKTVEFIDTKTGARKRAFPVDVREMLRCGAAQLPETPPHVTAASAQQDAEAPGSGSPSTSRGAQPGAIEQMDLPKMTVAELRDLARDAGVSGFSTLNKEDLVKALEEQ